MTSERLEPTVSVYRFQKSLYRLEAIKKACYRFLADFEVDITDSAEEIRVQLVEKHIGCARRFAAHQLPAEVLDQELREQVAAETQAMRDLILAQAFASFSLTNDSGETADFRDDPLDISRPDHAKRE